MALVKNALVLFRTFICGFDSSVCVEIYSFYSKLLVGVAAVVAVIGLGFLSSVSSGVRYHESQWPCFHGWGYQILFYLGSVLLFATVVSFG